MPDGIVCECNFTLVLDLADLIEKWDCLNLRHMSTVQHIIPKDKFTSLQRPDSFPEQHEDDVLQASLLVMIGRVCHCAIRFNL